MPYDSPMTADSVSVMCRSSLCRNTGSVQLYNLTDGEAVTGGLLQTIGPIA